MKFLQTFKSMTNMYSPGRFPINFQIQSQYLFLYSIWLIKFLFYILLVLELQDSWFFNETCLVYLLQMDRFNYRPYINHCLLQFYVHNSVIFAFILAAPQVMHGYGGQSQMEPRALCESLRLLYSTNVYYYAQAHMHMPQRTHSHA